MRKKLPHIFVTGGAGFIGSAFIRLAVTQGYKITVFDKLTYAGDLARLASIKRHITFIRGDISHKARVASTIKKCKPNTIVHFAAETHVDRSIKDVTPFIQTNIIGTQHLIEASLANKIKRFIHISTDEIYGQRYTGRFKETDPLKPRNPYAATKAAAEGLVQTAIETYRLPAIIIRPSNNYGPWQYPEKFIPVVILKALLGQRVPVYGKGKQVREWLHVDDCAQAVMTIMQKGKTGDVYNIGSYFEQPNIKTAKYILRLLKRPHRYIQFVPDRLGHDFRYSVDCSKLRRLGWKSSISFAKGIQETVNWYEKHITWCRQKLTKIK